MITSLCRIRSHESLCKIGWQTLLDGLGKTRADDEPLWIDEILDHNGFDDALRCLRAVDGYDSEIRMFAVWCARRVQHLMTDSRSIAVLDVIERHERGEASDDELFVAEKVAKEVSSLLRSMNAKPSPSESARHSAAAVAAAAAAHKSRVQVANAAWHAAFSMVELSLVERLAQEKELRRICSDIRETKP